MTAEIAEFAPRRCNRASKGPISEQKRRGVLVNFYSDERRVGSFQTIFYCEGHLCVSNMGASGLTIVIKLGAGNTNISWATRREYDSTDMADLYRDELYCGREIT